MPSTVAGRLAVFNTIPTPVTAAEGVHVAGNEIIPTDLRSPAGPEETLAYLEIWIKMYGMSQPKDTRLLWGVCLDPAKEPCSTLFNTMAGGGAALWNWTSHTVTPTGDVKLTGLTDAYVHGPAYDMVLTQVDGHPFIRSLVPAGTNPDAPPATNPAD